MVVVASCVCEGSGGLGPGPRRRQLKGMQVGRHILINALCSKHKGAHSTARGDEHARATF